MDVVLVEEFGGSDEVGGDADVFEYSPHVFVIEAGEGSREIEEEESAQGVGLHCASDCLVHVGEVGGDVTFVQETSLFWAA